MGLGIVELVIEVEEEFGIVISDEDAESIRTFDDLVAYVFSRVSKSTDRSEVAARIRRILAEEHSLIDVQGDDHLAKLLD